MLNTKNNQNNKCYNFYYAIYWLKCILLVAPENSERSEKISEHLNTHIGKGYKPVLKVWQNSERSRRSYVRTKNGKVWKWFYSYHFQTIWLGSNFFFIGLIVQKISLIICNFKTILLIILQVIEQKFCKLQNGSPRTATAYEAASG